jgi:hypothetical protein
MKKTKIFFLISMPLILLVINYRTPFFRNSGGPWSIGYGFSTSFPDTIKFKKDEIYSVERLKALQPKTRFLADPFFLKVKDTFYIFFEHQLVTPKAEIGLLTSIDGVNYKYRGTVLKAPFHLSYPQVFYYKKEYYMIPESKQANAVLLYKAKKFPYDWAICDTLLNNVSYADPTIFLSDTLNIMAVSDTQLNLKLYQADSLFGDWKLHKNPILVSGSESRCGGRFITDEKGLLLPVQNCLKGYGYGVSLYRLNFKKGNHTMKREKPFFLKRQDQIREFNFGMHQLDIQKIDNSYYYVYDGNRIKNANKHLNIKGGLKINLIDLKQWFFNLLPND